MDARVRRLARRSAPAAASAAPPHGVRGATQVYPRNSGEIYLCGIGGSEYVDGERLRAGEFPPGEVHADPARVKAATDSFSTMSRRLGGTPDTVQACMRPCPPDALPYMGRVRGFTNAYMSAGHNCWGILWAPVSGKARRARGGPRRPETVRAHRDRPRLGDVRAHPRRPSRRAPPCAATCCEPGTAVKRGPL